MDDIKFMKAALKLSKKGLGLTEPNPMVGAIVVKNRKILATGYHPRYGKAHAEQMALANVQKTGSTLYVTLEPCLHYGKTPPCTDLIIEKKVKRVVIAMTDPNPIVNGKGIQQLQQNNIQVEAGLLADMARKINRHYITFMTEKRPFVTLKAGISIDAKLTDKNRQSQWITDEHLRAFSHSFRGEFSAIMAGVQTVIDDNPQLTLREAGWGDKRFYRVILDSQNRLDSSLRIFQEQDRFPLILISSTQAPNRSTKVQNHFFVTPLPDGNLDLVEVLKILYQMGIASVMVEGGGRLFDSFLKAQLYDEIVFSVADKLIGGASSVQFFPSGTTVNQALVLKDREIIPLQTGYIVRGYRV